MSSEFQSFEEIAAIEFLGDTAAPQAVELAPAMIFRKRLRRVAKTHSGPPAELFPFDPYLVSEVAETEAAPPPAADDGSEVVASADDHDDAAVFFDREEPSGATAEARPTLPDLAPAESAERDEHPEYEITEEPTRPERLGAVLPQAAPSRRNQRNRTTPFEPFEEITDEHDELPEQEETATEAGRARKRPKTTDLDLEPPSFQADETLPVIAVVEDETTAEARPKSVPSPPPGSASSEEPAVAVADEASYPELELEEVAELTPPPTIPRTAIEFDANVHFTDDDEPDTSEHIEGGDEDFDLVIDEEPLPARELDSKRPLGMTLGRKEWFEKAFTLDSVLNLRLTPPTDSVRRVSYFMRLLKMAPPASVLDLCCGLGDLSVEFARRGFKVVGLDLSMEVLRHAYTKTKSEKLPLQFAHGDMRSLDFEEIFDVVINADSSFGYFDDLTNFDVLRRIYRCLRPGGRFLLDVVNRDFLLQFLPHRAFWKGDQCTVLEEVRFNHVTSQLVNQRAIIFDGGRQKEDTIVIRLYSLHELLNMLANAGFEILSVFGGPRERYFLGQESRQMIIISRKAENAGHESAG